MPKTEKKTITEITPTIKAKFVISGCSSENSSEYVNHLTRCLTQFKNNPEFEFTYNVMIIPHDEL